MTAPLRNRPFSPQEWPVSGDHITSRTPGTLWERVADSAPSDLTRYLLALGVGSNSVGSARDTVRRVLAGGVGHNWGRAAYEDTRRAFDERLALERAKAAHPAGKGRQQATDE